MNTPLATLLELLLFENISQLIWVSTIILIAGVVRGCIGFGFSAIVVTSASLWLPVTAVVPLVVMLEIAASLAMIPSIKRDINYDYLIPLSAGLLVTNFIGVWCLATLPANIVQSIIGVYMIIIALLTMIGYEYRGLVTREKIFGIGLIAGFFSGLSAVGGIFAAWALVSLRSSPGVIRATLAIFFLIGQVLFLIGAYFNELYSWQIFYTALYATLPLVCGIQLGTLLFGRVSNNLLKKMVLVGLITLSLWGLYKIVAS